MLPRVKLLMLVVIIFEEMNINTAKHNTVMHLEHDK